MRRAAFAIPCIAAVLIGACAAATTDSTESDRERIYIRRGAPYTTEYDFALETETETVAETYYTEEVTFAEESFAEMQTCAAYEPQTEAVTVAQTEPETEAVAQDAWTDLDETYAVFIAKTLYGECKDGTKAEQAAVVWCILNRVDSTIPYIPDDVIAVITQENQFAGYNENYPVLDDLMIIARDVLCRWYAEKRGVSDVGRVLPHEYMWFHGDGYHNYFRNTEDNIPGTQYWDWSSASPYTD